MSTFTAEEIIALAEGAAKVSAQNARVAREGADAALAFAAVAVIACYFAYRYRMEVADMLVEIKRMTGGAR